jgi:hypothetical protein
MLSRRQDVGSLRVQKGAVNGTNYVRSKVIPQNINFYLKTLVVFSAPT